MSQDIVNTNQNISYTNRDFQSIYTEALDITKQLTKKWDPSLSDESDPGVMIFKLISLLADKLNYNVDKSILEAFPLSVTQDSNARQLYEQLGYFMRWYNAATVPVTISWKASQGDEAGNVLSYTVPKFTTISDDDETVVYSLVGVEGSDGIVVSDGILYTDSNKNLNMIAYEGIPVQYTFNGETTITSNLVDANNRLYFTTPYVFENAIFINNIEQDNYIEWKKVDNLYEDSFNVLRYRFGYDSSSNLAYIEFPDNYSELFGSGIEITYLTFTTDESYADVPTQYLSKFLTNTTVGDNNEITLTTNVVSVANTLPASGHLDKEDINEAYENYKKTVATFNTLITLRDYVNYIRREELDVCSNAFVTDRTNDPQSTYKIVNQHNGVQAIIPKVEQSTDNIRFIKTKDEDVMLGKTYYTKGSSSYNAVSSPKVSDLGSYYELQGEDMLSAFSLKFYLLQKAVALTQRLAYDNTFEMMNENIDIDTLLGDTSHLVHNFEDILPLGESEYILTSDTTVPTNNGQPSKIYYIYNKQNERYEPIPVVNFEYNPRDLHLFEDTSYYTPSNDADWFSGKTYYKKNSTGNYVKYGDDDSKVLPPRNTPNCYDYVIQYSLTKDTSINPNHTYYKFNPKTTNYDEYHFPTSNANINPKALGLFELNQEALLSRLAFIKNKYPISMSVATYNAVGIESRSDITKNIMKALYENLDSDSIEFGNEISLDYLTQIVRDSDSRIKNVSFEALSYTTHAVYYDGNKKEFVEIQLPNSLNDLDINNFIVNPNYEAVTSYFLGKDILCKSILAGTTQLLVPDDAFNYHINNKFIKYVDGIQYITGETTINMNSQDGYYVLDDVSNPKINRSYKLKQNEALTLYRPSFTNTEEFTSGVHYEYKLFSDLQPNSSYQLKSGEVFIFYTSTMDSEGNLSGYTVYVYGIGCIINSSKLIQARNSLSVYGNKAVDIATTNYTLNNVQYKHLTYTYPESRIAEIQSINSDTTISNTKINTNEKIAIQSLDRFTVDESDGYRFIWVLNTPKYDGSVKQYELFKGYDPKNEEDLANIQDINSYTLKSGEYIYYTDSSISSLGILGAGTTVYRDCGVNTDSVSPIEDNPFVFLNWTTLPNVLKSGFIGLTTSNESGNGVVNPKLNGFYEQSSGNTYKRTTDEVLKPNTSYYVLVMKNVAGWFVTKSSDTQTIYSPAAVPVTSVFTAIDVSLEYPNLIDINPKEKGLYERISFNNNEVVDSYYLAAKSCKTSEDYVNGERETAIGMYYRYAETLDETVDINKVYYKLNDYCSKTFGKISPLVCNAIDSVDMTLDPLKVLRKYYQIVQPNTALTFTKNQLWSLTEGDTISFKSLVSANVTLPTFTNKESLLNLNLYDITYQRTNDEIRTLENINIDGCNWTGYSNLLLNTNTSNGQKLQSNHTLKLYKAIDDIAPTIITPENNHNVYFQLKYPITNLLSDFANVTTSTLTQDNMDNILYEYSIVDSTDDYFFSTDNYSTQLYMKKIDENLKSTVSITNLRLPEGKYLIPVQGLSKARIEIRYNNKVLKSMSSDKNYFLGDKMHYAVLDINETEAAVENNTLTVLLLNSDGKEFTQNTAGEKITVILYDIFKYEFNPNINSQTKDYIIAKIKRLDENEQFDYTYVPNKDDIIEDPLDSKSFWNKNHILNKFTIAQMNADSIEQRFIT